MTAPQPRRPHRKGMGCRTFRRVVCRTCPTEIVATGRRAYCLACAEIRRNNYRRRHDDARRETWRESKRRQRGMEARPFLPRGRPPRVRPDGPPISDAILAAIDADMERKRRDTYATTPARCGVCAQVSVGVTCQRCGAPR